MTTRRRQYAAVADAAPFVVGSCADGTLKITPGFRLGREVPGVCERIYLAFQVERVLNRAARATITYRRARRT